MAKQILRIEPIHSETEFTERWKHDYRVNNVPNADKEKSHLNKVLVSMPLGETYNTVFERKKEKLTYYKTHELRKNAVKGIDVLMSYSADEVPPDFDIEKWAEKSIEFLKDHFGGQNVVSAVLHLDERTPHIHAMIVPVDEKGKINASRYIGGRSDLRMLHDEYANYTKEVNLERGNRYVLRDHVSTRQFYADINQPIDVKLSKPEKDESIDEYYERASSQFEAIVKKDTVRQKKIDDLIKEKEALEKANKTFEEKFQQEIANYQNHFEREIGSISNAKAAIAYRDRFEHAFEWLEKNNKQLCDAITSQVEKVFVEYEHHLKYDEIEETVEKSD